jgi:hypothetical protein
MPVLLVQSDLHLSAHGSVDSRHVPGPLINVQVVLWDLNFLSNWLTVSLADKSNPKSIIQMWSTKHESETLMSLEVGTIGWTFGRVVKRGVWWLVEIKNVFLIQVTYGFLLCKLLTIHGERDCNCTW